MARVKLDYASIDAVRATVGRRVVAGAADMLLLVVLQAPLHLYDYVLAWAGSRSPIAICLALALLLAFVIADAAGVTVGKRMLGLRVVARGGLGLYATRGLYKWWWLLASPLVLDWIRPAGSIFKAFGVARPDWSEAVASIALTAWPFVLVWIVLDGAFGLVSAGSFVHDRLSRTTVFQR